MMMMSDFVLLKILALKDLLIMSLVKFEDKPHLSALLNKIKQLSYFSYLEEKQNLKYSISFLGNNSKFLMVLFCMIYPLYTYTNQW